MNWKGVEINPYWIEFGRNNHVPISKEKLDKINEKFDVITSFQVLEHVENPKIIMRKIKKILKNNGILYIEVPDAKASIEGKYREEFFIEHLHVFSMKSLRNTLKKIKFKIIKIKSIKENSGKYTLYAFCKKF